MKMRMTFMLAVGLLGLSSVSASASCYHKIGDLCKDGYSSGFQSDCTTPCTTGATGGKKDDSQPVALKKKKRGAKGSKAHSAPLKAQGATEVSQR